MGEVKESFSNKVIDGFFKIDFKEDGVFITVYPPEGKGKKVEARDIIDKLNRKQVKSYNKDLVEMSVLKADKNSYKIAERQEELKIDASASIMITPDKMKALITIYPPEGGRVLAIDDVIDLLNKQGISYGISRAALDKITKNPAYNEFICIAEGSLAVNGQSGKYFLHFDTSSEHKPTILEDGRVDFRELNLIENIHKGQVLATLVPPVAGIPGKTVTGIELRAIDGKPANLPRGKNVEVSEDGISLISSLNGQVSYIDGKVSVYSNYEVPADVDNTTGNISFIGNVNVKGNVLSGFSIDAGGNVEVWGVVEGAVIKAGGDIILRRGMQGIGKGILISGGDIIARYIEHSSIEAKNSIKAEAIMHSNIKCGNKLELSGRKGLLVGGSCKVGKEIVAKVIGSPMATVTDIEVGVDPSLKERYRALKDEIITIENDMKKADQAITILKKIEAAGALTPDKQEIMLKSVRTKVHYSNKINELKDETAIIEEKLQQDAYGKIRASNTVYPGTKVAIGTCMMYIKENLQYCTLYRDGADIRVGSIDK